MAVGKQFPDGVRQGSLHLMSDNGYQPTSVSFTKAIKLMGIHQAFTSYNNPKGNADTERFMRTLKEEIVWPQEWTSPEAFKKRLEEWIESGTITTTYILRWVLKHPANLNRRLSYV